jgi:hypothetical protein
MNGWTDPVMGSVTNAVCLFCGRRQKKTKEDNRVFEVHDETSHNVKMKNDIVFAIDESQFNKEKVHSHA